MSRAIAYLRTSSAANVGGDSDVRQRDAINAYAGRAGLQIAQEFYDAAISGADPLDARPGFSALLAWASENDVKTIVVENASRFARDLIVQEVGFRMLADRGFTLIAADDPDAFTADTPTARMVRQILGAVAEFEKANLVAKLKGARERARAARGGKCEGRKGYREQAPALVQRAAELRAAGETLQGVAAMLAAEGWRTVTGRTFDHSQVRRLLKFAASAPAA